jgi:hypothetical protein
MRRRLLSILALGLLLAGSTQASGALLASGNLVQNGSAESGSAATSDSQTVAPAGWTTAGTFTAVRYGVSGLPSAPAGGGSNLFAGGPGSADSTATQTIDVSGNSAAIDGGAAQVTLAALPGGWESQEDSATVSAVYVGSGDVVLGETTIGPVRAADRGYKSVLLPRVATAEVPAKTRKIRVVIEARRSSGYYNDGYADNVSLALLTASPPTGRYAFYFRVYDRTTDFSAGMRGTFETDGQPDDASEVDVVKVVAPTFKAKWKDKRSYSVTLAFDDVDGHYNVALHELELPLIVRSSNFRCRGTGKLSLRKDGSVELAFCGKHRFFDRPRRASSWIKQR